jgi:hypothetical protein
VRSLLIKCTPGVFHLLSIDIARPQLFRTQPIKSSVTLDRLGHVLDKCTIRKH